MTFKEIWTSIPPDGKRGLATRLNTSVCYLSQIAHGHALPSPKFVRTMVRELGGKVKPEELRPDVYGTT